MSAQAWSWLLAVVGLTGLFLAGRRRAVGWAIGLGAQFLWIGFAFQTGQWGFLASAAGYGGMYLWNWWSWTRGPKGERVPRITTRSRGSSTRGRVVRDGQQPVGDDYVPALQSPTVKPKVQSRPAEKPSGPAVKAHGAVMPSRPPSCPSGVSPSPTAGPVWVYLPGATFDAGNGNVIGVTDNGSHAIVHLASGAAMPVSASKAAAWMEIRAALDAAAVR